MPATFMRRRTKRKLARRPMRRRRVASSLFARPTTRTWNCINGATPAMRNTQGMDGRTYTFVGTAELGNVLTSSSTLPIVTYGTSFGAGGLNNFSALSTVFDEYRIKSVEVWLRCAGPACSPTYATNLRLVSVIDYDNTTVTGYTSGNFESYANCITTSQYDGHYRKWVPHVADALYAGAFTGYGNKIAPWIDCQSNAVQHYGLKCAIINASSSNGDLVVSLTYRVTVEFKYIQ